LKNVPGAKRSSNGNRFKTDAQTPAEAGANHQFLASYREAYDLTEAREFDEALVVLTELIKTVTQQQRAECHGLRGYVFLQRMELEKSISECSKSIKLNPDDPQTWSWRAAARGEQNQWRLAFEDLHQATKRSSDRREEFQALMQSYAKVAVEHFRQQVTKGNSTAKLLFERGWMYFRLGNASKAARDFQQALTLNPEHPWASSALAKLANDADHSSMQMSDEELQQLCHHGLQGENECQRMALTVLAKIYYRQHRSSDVADCLAQLSKLAGESQSLQLEVAELQYQLDDSIAAAESLTRLLKANPQFYAAWLLRGKCAFAMRNDSLAVDDFSEYLLHDPDNVSALVQRAEVETRRQNYDLAMDDVDRALEIDELDFDAWLMRGKIASASAQLDAAMTSCDRAKAINNQSAEVYALLATVFRQMGDFGRAAEEYSRSVDYAKSNLEKADYLYRRGIEWYELEEFEDSFNDFSQSLELRPDHAGTLIWRAAASSRVEKLGGAIEDLQHAIEIRPSSADAYRQLGKAVADKAIGHFTRRQQRGREEPDMFRQRGQAYQFLSQYDEAIKDFTAALNLDKKDIAARIARGQALCQKGNYKASFEDFSKAISIDPNCHAAYYGRARALFEQGSVETARSDIEQAIALSSSRSRYHALAGQIANKEGNLAAQLESLNHAVAYDSTDPSLYLDRAIVHESSGQLEAAMRDLTGSLELEPNQVSVLQRRAQLALRMSLPLQAIEDFGKVLGSNPVSIASWIGMAQALAANDQHQDGLICLTKAMHRFSKGQDLAQIVFARGRLFQSTGRLAPAATDFSVVIDLLKDFPEQQARAILARGIVCAQLDEFETSLQDFQTLEKSGFEGSEKVTPLINWLNDRQKPRPDELAPPTTMIRPTRPPIISTIVPNWLPETTWEQPPPHDQWVVNIGSQKEYGPVRYDIMLLWIREGRLDAQTRLLRSDWNRWRRLDKLFSNLSGGSRSGFPEIKE
jgi:tetratricopeptide (TPR) repeat protein